MPTYIDRRQKLLVQTGKTEGQIINHERWVGCVGVEASRGWSSTIASYPRGTDDEAGILEKMNVSFEDLNKISELPETFPATVGLVAVCEITDELLKQAGILA